MQDRDRFLRKFTSVKLVGGCASHGCGVDRPDLIHVFGMRFSKQIVLKVNHTLVSKGPSGRSSVPRYHSTIRAIHKSSMAERKVVWRTTVAGRGFLPH